MSAPESPPDDPDSTAFPALARRFRAVGGDAARAGFEGFAADFRAMLGMASAEPEELAAAVRHMHDYAAWSWDARCAGLVPEVTQALRSLPARPHLPLVLELANLLFFLGWCFEASNLAQCRMVLPGLSAAAGAMATSARPVAAPRRGRPRIAFLSMFVARHDVMMAGPRFLIDALRHLPGGCDLSMVAWRFAEPGYVEELRASGVAVTVTGGETPAEQLAEAEAAIAALAPDILITDMNNAVPLAVFARRAAPVQLFLSGGLPAFPQPGLDGVFDSFGIGAAACGWGKARVLPFRPPWDLEMLLPPRDESQIAAERAAMPPGDGPVFGVYGRLVKLTPEYLRAVERILLAVPRARFVAGGTGDPAPILAFAAASPAGSRIHAQARFVPGHAWGRVLDVFLDTWPLTGGESVRECMAKGCPVVSLHSPEMPALDRQRDPLLLARDWDGFVGHAVPLLTDAGLRREASVRAIAFARRMADPAPMRADTAAAIRLLRRDARWRAMAASLKRLLGAKT